MAEIGSICVYCGSGTGRNPAYARAAQVLGQQLAARGIRLVYGGGAIGLMGLIARTVLAGGGAVTGIIPRFMTGREKMLEGLTELIVTEDMHERKKLMFDRADAFVALPGGIGTLEETVEQLTWAQLGQHEKPIALVDIDGFWQPLRQLLDHMAAEAFIRPGIEVRYLMIDSAEAVIDRIVAAAAPLAPSEMEGAPEPLERM
jgi:hypothetical protein